MGEEGNQKMKRSKAAGPSRYCSRNVEGFPRLVLDLLRNWQTSL